MRITITDLREAIKTANYYLAESGSNYYLAEASRNGYQAVDIFYVDESGNKRMERNLECGTSRECVTAVYQFQKDNYGKLQFHTKATRAMALTVCSMQIDMGLDFHALLSRQVDVLLVWSKLTKYRRPANANSSTGSYFHAHLVRLAAKQARLAA